MCKTVCLITTNHIATNPRLVKEAMALESAGYKVHLLFTQESKYSSELDEKLLSENPSWQHTKLNWTGDKLKSKFWRFWFGLQQKTARRIATKYYSLPICFVAANRNFRWQLNRAKKINADLFIAHNLGALPVAVLAAKKRGVVSGFDAEDFHRHEASDNINDKEVRLKSLIENKCIPQVQHFTAASPLIAEAYEQLFPMKSPTVILNVFPKPKHIQKTEPSKQLRLYWFSQTVGTNRGLQDVFKAMRRLDGQAIVFDIYGVVPANSKSVFEELISELNFSRRPEIYFKGTIPPDELMALACNYDVGLALEPGFSINNRIALSNKIFTYLYGGNAIIFSNTPAQQAFYKQYSDTGFIYDPGDDVNLAKHLKTYFIDSLLLNNHRQYSRRLFMETMNWEDEKNVFLKKISDLLYSKSGNDVSLIFKGGNFISM